MGTVVRPVHDGLVGPFEVEGVDHGFAQAAVAQLVAARVHEPTLGARGRLVGQHLFLDAPVADRGKIIARRPDARGELLAEQIVLGGESLESNVAVAVIFEAHDVEIVLAARDRKVGAPPILHPLEFDETAGGEAAHLVGARSERNVERRFVERTAGVIGLREDRHDGHEQRHVARTFRGE